MLAVQFGHVRSHRRYGVAEEEEYGQLWGQVEALADHEDELIHSQAACHEEPVFVKVDDLRVFHLFANDGQTVRVAIADCVGLRLAVLVGVGVLVLAVVLGAHRNIAFDFVRLLLLEVAVPLDTLLFGGPVPLGCCL